MSGQAIILNIDGNALAKLLMPTILQPSGGDEAMRMPGTITQAYEVHHQCGFPFRIELELNVKWDQKKLSEVEMTLSGGNVRYYRLDTNECTTYCPGCGRNLPKVEAVKE